MTMDLSNFDQHQIDDATHSQRIHDLHRNGTLKDYNEAMGGKGMKRESAIKENASLLDAVARFKRVLASKYEEGDEARHRALEDAEQCENHAAEMRSAL